MEFSIIETLTAAPAQCRVCGGAEKSWYLDLGIQEEFYGAVVYCSECIGAMADICGFLSPAAKNNLESQIVELERQLFQFKVELDGLRDVKSGLDKLGYRLSSDPALGTTDDSPRSDAVVPETLESESEGTSASGNVVGSGAGETSEQVNDQGVGVLRSDEFIPGDFKLRLSLD